jgi:hypothetical protein
MPYVALPTTAPSNCTCTPLMAVPTADVLLIAHPDIVTVPETVPATG